MADPAPSFTTAPSVPPALSEPLASYLAAHPTLDGLATGALVFWPAASAAAAAWAAASGTPDTPPPRILLLQRAPHDSMPLRWETPGGAADAADAGIAAAAARELREEAGLDARAVRAVVGDGFAFRTRAGRRLRKVSFVVEVAVAHEDKDEPPRVRLDPAEHVAFVWASEAECRAGRVGRAGGPAIPFTHPDQEAVVLAGFRMWEQLVREGAEEANRRG